MESESKPYVIISRNRGLVIMSTGDLNFRSYRRHLEISKGQSDEVIFSRYGINERDFELAVEAIDEIHEKPLSEVSGEVRGLIKKLKGETQ